MDYIIVKQLLTAINKQQFNSKNLSLLLIYIYENDIKSRSELISQLTKHHLEIHTKIGQIYAIYNEMFDKYGENILKLGFTTNLQKRLKAYVTCYFKPCILKYESVKISYPSIAESVLFVCLSKQRLANNREFFDCDINIVKSTMTTIIKEFETLDIMDIINKYSIEMATVKELKSNILKLLDNYEDKLKDLIKDDISRSTGSSIINTYEKIIESADITDEQFAKFSLKTLDELDNSQKYEIEKYTIKKMHNINTIDTEILNSKYKETQTHLTINYFKGISHILRNSKEWILKKQMIDDVIKKLGFTNIGNGVKLTRSVFSDNIKKVINECELFTDINKSQPLFKFNKPVFNNKTTIKQFMGFINTLLNKCGFIIKSNKKNKKVNKKVIQIMSYSLDYI
ncbi:MAG: hypothetical protein Barrevirus1_61 [Barrevirus sp.]|uniref:Bacteriophage T5 Orf172 DNA-binding domain-containing protein n=1 Tax=Barrevirus sp. TaxID=2487763 RepID=A0A3G4ZTT9_9VIRU|nr:MAG: hypothetical protein Barrevirus1_61 [Barrevirus sp.]